MTPEIIAFTTRAVVITLTTLAAIMCIYLGWRLYFEAIRVRGKIELEAGNFKLSMTTAAPGLFFATFGAGLLIFTLQTKVEYTQESAITTPGGEAPESVSSRWPVSSFASFDDSLYASNMRVATAKKAASRPCLYKSKANIKWFDSDKNLSESEQIVKALDEALLVLTEEIRRNPADVALQNTYSVLESARDGFKP